MDSGSPIHLISSSKLAHITPALSLCENLRMSHIHPPPSFSPVCSCEWSEWYIINMSKKGNERVGVRRGGGSGESRRRGKEVRTDDAWGAQAVNLQGVGTFCRSPRKVTLTRTGQVLHRTVPRSAGARPSWWREMVGCEAVHLASFTTTEVTDKILSWSRAHGFVKMIGNEGKPGREAAVRDTGGSERSRTGRDDSRGATVKRSACVYSPLKMFSLVYPSHRLLFFKEVTQSTRLHNAIHLDSMYVTIHNHVL